MKTTVRLLVFMLAICVSTNFYSQEEAKESSQQEFKPVYITMTTTHWNDDPETDFSGWLDTEKEYFEKVIKKNDLVMSSGVYTHYFTPDNSEIVMVNVYKNWADIEKAEEINQKLIEEAWPEEKDRQAFFEKQRGYYKPDHKDEIYLSMPFMIPEADNSGESRIYYIRSSELAMNGNGKPEKFKEHFEKVTKKSKRLKGYYTHRHLWGSNSREMAEVFVFDKLGDIEDFFDEEQEIVNSTWADEEERNTFFKDLNSNFTGKHADYVYRSVPELQK